MNKKRKFRFDGAKVFSVVASLAIIAALVVGVVSIVKSASAGKKQNSIDLNMAEKKTEETSDRRVENVTDATTAYVPEEKTDAPTIAAAAEESESAEKVNAPIYNFNESSSLMWPVEGSIILAYNMDSTIYFPTLEQYKCNPAVIIGAQTGAQVISSAPGVVENIYDDSVTGKTLVMSIGDGYKLTYGQLEDIKVNISDNVEAGTVIGSIADPTRFYSVEGSNLYFQLTKDGEYVDPMLYLVEKN